MIKTNFLANIRQRNNWTQEEMAGVLGVSRPTYIALEKGKGSVTIEQVNKLANRLGCETGDILTENVTDEEKYKEVIIEAIKNGAGSDGRIAKTKLAKLVYLADFGWYYSNLESMTGARYRRLPQGPVPNIYFSTIDELFDSGLINIKVSGEAQMIELTKAGKMLSTDKLKNKEKRFIQTVGKKWLGKRSAEIVKFTHEQLPYKICNPGEVIPYELITQQDPEHVY